MNHEILGGWKNIITFLLGTGCRIGECVGMTWDDIDFENREIHVNQVLLYRPNKNGKSEFSISTPKTKAGYRIIPMLNEVYEALMDERALQMVLFGGKTETIDGVSNFVFTQSNGKVYIPQEINRGMARIIEDYNAGEIESAENEGREASLFPHFSTHHLRHTFCTRLCETDLPVKQIQDIMGHKDIQTTLNIYAEVNPEARRMSLTKLDGKIII